MGKLIDRKWVKGLEFDEFHDGLCPPELIQVLFNIASVSLLTIRGPSKKECIWKGSKISIGIGFEGSCQWRLSFCDCREWSTCLEVLVTGSEIVGFHDSVVLLGILFA